jgi:hypothetical protein
MTMIENYYTPEQLESLARRREELGEAGEALIQQAPQRWAELHAGVQAAMDAGIEPSDPKAQELAQQWFALVTDFTSGDPGIFVSLKRIYQNEDTIHGMDVAAMRPGLEGFQKAAAAAGIKLPG